VVRSVSELVNFLLTVNNYDIARDLSIKFKFVFLLAGISTLH